MERTGQRERQEGTGGAAPAGRAALITGGTSGIGLAAARLLLARGISVLLAGRSEERGRRALAALSPAKGEAPQARYFSCDVTRAEDCRAAVREAVSRFGRLDILINSAGIYAEGALEDMTEAQFDALMAVNVRGTYFMCQAALPELKRQRGAIVNIASDAGLHGNYFCTAYCASKGAVVLFTRALALEAARFGVRVNCVCPGDVMTPLTERQLAAAASHEDALREMASVYPMGRIGTAEEAAAVAVFLASAEASFVTGAAWGVDGGLTA